MKVPKGKVFKTFVAVVSFFVVQKMCLSSADEYSTFKSHGHVTFVDMRRDSNDKSSRIFIQINNKLSSNKKIKKWLNSRHTLIFKTGMSVRACHESDQRAECQLRQLNVKPSTGSGKQRRLQLGSASANACPNTSPTGGSQPTTERNAGMFKMFHWDSRPDWSFTGRKGLHIEQHCLSPLLLVVTDPSSLWAEAKVTSHRFVVGPHRKTNKHSHSPPLPV